jgi:hypothetical protein
MSVNALALRDLKFEVKAFNENLCKQEETLHKLEETRDQTHEFQRRMRAVKELQSHNYNDDTTVKIMQIFEKRVAAADTFLALDINTLRKWVKLELLSSDSNTKQN